MKMTKILLVVALCAAASLSSCATDKSTDAELRRAEAVVSAAEISLNLAKAIYEPRLNDPSYSPAERVAAQAIINEATKRLDDERARLEEIKRKRAQEAELMRPDPGEPPASPLLPPVTATK